MGTNYYLHLKPDLLGKLKGEDTEILHIGKSSGGWCFALHVIPGRGIMGLRDWCHLWHKNKSHIEDEYGHVVSIAQMIDVITNRSWQSVRSDALFPQGPYRSLAHFYEMNWAVEGPNNLLRSKLDMTHCIGHGAGTWDLIIGDFS